MDIEKYKKQQNEEKHMERINIVQACKKRLLLLYNYY